MARQRNDIDEHLRRLLDTLTQVNFQSDVADGRMRRDRQRGEESIRKWEEGSPAVPFGALFGHGSALPIGDPFSGSGATYPYASMAAGGAGYLNILTEVCRRIQAESLTIVYEELERYFKAVSSILYYQHRRHSADAWPIDVRFTAMKLFDRRLNGTFQYYQGYVKWLTSRNCAELLKVLEARLPGFSDRARTNPRGQDLLDAYRALEFCRHTTVHAAGRIDERQVQRLPPSARDIVLQTRNTSAITNEQKILPDRHITGELISWMADLAYVLYRAASDDGQKVIGYEPSTGWA